MYFLSKLSEKELINIINSCIRDTNKEIGLRLQPIDKAQVVSISNGEQIVMIVQTFLEEKLQDAYHIDDYSMTSHSYIQQSHEPIINFSDYYKTAMVRHFGSEYIEEVLAYRKSMAYQEMRKLSEALSTTRK